MNLYLMISILLVNLIAIAIVYQFIKKLDNRKKIIFMAISVASMYGLISLVYWFSGFGIDKMVHEQSKNFIIYLFVPINVVLFVPYIAFQYMKFRNKNINLDKFAKRISSAMTLLIIVLIAEFFCFRSIQNNIGTIADNAIQNSQTNNIIENTSDSQNNINNEIIENIELNEIEENTIQNEVKTNQID